MSGGEAMFFSRFIAGNALCAVFGLILMLGKRLAGRRLTPAFHYWIWLMFMLALTAVFLPEGVLQPLRYAGNESGGEYAAVSNAAAGLAHVPENGGAYDAVILVKEPRLPAVLCCVWASGAALGGVAFAKGALELHRLRRKARAVNGGMLAVFYRCGERVRVRRQIWVLQSPRVRAPVSFGLVRPCVIVPDGSLDAVTCAEMEHVFLHELTHIRHWDSAMNYLACALAALYWFNPVVHLAFEQMRRDREAYCDWSVLCRMATVDERLNYGHTLLRFASGPREQPLGTENGFGGSARLRYRIELISQFEGRTKKSAVYGFVLLTAAAVLLVSSLPVLAEFSAVRDVYVPGRTLAVEQADYSAFFGGWEGCAVVYDMSADRYTAYRPEELTRRIPACSTYKLLSALNALEQGIITPQRSTLAWDGTPQPFAAWCGEQDLRSAMQNSVNWYFQQLDAVAGSTLAEFCREIGCAGEGPAGGDWADGAGLKISPLEQVELLRRIYGGELDCSPENIEAVRQAMLISEGGSGRLYGKTGTGKNGDTEIMGWFIGCAQTGADTYFFAVNVRSGEGVNGADAQEIAREIMESMGIEI